MSKVVLSCTEVICQDDLMAQLLQKFQEVMQSSTEHSSIKMNILAIIRNIFISLHHKKQQGFMNESFQAIM